MTAYREQNRRTWRYDFRWKGRRYTGRGYATKRKANRAAEAKRRELDAGLSDPFPSFAALVTAWLEQGATRKSAHHVYQSMVQLEKAFGHLGHLRPRDIQRGHVEPILVGLRKTRKATTCNAYRRDILAVFNWAESMGAVPRNPVRGIPAFPTEESSRQPIPTADLKKLVLAADPLLRARLTFISQTGCRWVETARLRWNDLRLDVALPFGVLTSKKRRGGHERKRPQPLTKTALRAVDSMRDRDAEFVFPAPGGGQAHYTTDKYQLATLCRRLDLQSYGFHQVRHWAGLVTAQAGTNPKAIADFLGHSSTTATQRYMHWSAPEMWALAERLEQELDLAAEEAVDGVIEGVKQPAVRRNGRQ